MGQDAANAAVESQGALSKDTRDALYALGKETTLQDVRTALQNAATQTGQSALAAKLDAILAMVTAQGRPYLGAVVTKTDITPGPAATVSAQLVPANPKRLAFIVWNNGTNSCYVSFGAVSAASTCAKILATFTGWECFWPVAYTGAISAIRNAGTGGYTVWEFSAP